MLWYAVPGLKEMGVNQDTKVCLLLSTLFGGGVELSPLLLRPQPWMMTSVEQSVECLAGETGVLGGKPALVLPSGKPATNGTAYALM
jgi:hypothetical protein